MKRWIFINYEFRECNPQFNPYLFTQWKHKQQQRQEKQYFNGDSSQFVTVYNFEMRNLIPFNNLLLTVAILFAPHFFWPLSYLFSWQIWRNIKFQWFLWYSLCPSRCENKRLWDKETCMLPNCTTVFCVVSNVDGDDDDADGGRRQMTCFAKKFYSVRFGFDNMRICCLYGTKVCFCFYAVFILLTPK